MPRLTIHVGAPKTGTSALQSALAANVERLLDDNILYPYSASQEHAKIGLISSGNGVALARLLNPNKPGRVTTDHLRDEIGKAFRKGYELLYSSEAIGSFHAGEMREFRSFVADVGYELKIVAYVRAIADHAMSAYQQMIKRDLYTGSFLDFLKTRYVGSQSRLINKLVRTLDEGSYIVRNYDCYKDNLFKDFLANVLGIQDLEGYVIENRRVNRSLTEFEIALLRFMNTIFENQRHCTFVSDSLIYGAKDASYNHRISAEAMSLIEEKFSGDLETINRAMPETPLALKTDRIQVSDEPQRELGESDAAFASIIAGLVRSAKQASDDRPPANPRREAMKSARAGRRRAGVSREPDEAAPAGLLAPRHD